MIYQHEAQGADKTITDAIDTHVQDQKHKDDDQDGRAAGVLAPRANGTGGREGPATFKAQAQNVVLTWAFTSERVTGIEPAPSAWESVPSGPFYGLTCGTGCPRVTTRHRANGPANPGPAWAVHRALPFPVLLDSCNPAAETFEQRGA
jgi:hypothetical protein